MDIIWSLCLCLRLLMLLKWNQKRAIFVHFHGIIQSFDVNASAYSLILWFLFLCFLYIYFIPMRMVMKVFVDFHDNDPHTHTHTHMKPWRNWPTTYFNQHHKPYAKTPNRIKQNQWFLFLFFTKIEVTRGASLFAQIGFCIGFCFWIATLMVIDKFITHIRDDIRLYCFAFRMRIIFVFRRVSFKLTLSLWLLLLLFLLLSYWFFLCAILLVCFAWIALINNTWTYYASTRQSWTSIPI